MAVDGANRHDMKPAGATLDALMLQRPQNPQGLCLDKGYDGPFAQPRRGTTRHTRAGLLRPALGGGAHTWLVEPIPGLADSLGQEGQNYLAFLHLVCAIITWRETGLWG